MRWLSSLVDQIIAEHPSGEILIESGASPSGTYHMGHLREIITCDAILLEIRERGRQARHIQFADDLDALRKIPVNISAEFEKYLGKPLCDIPSPDGSDKSYAEFFLSDFINSAEVLGVEMEVVNSHEKYRSGYFVPAIEKVLSKLPEAKRTLETISGRKLDDHWSPIQIMEDGYLKNRKFISIDAESKQITYEDSSGVNQHVAYSDGNVKLDWRLDWPGRWWLMNVSVEPFGRDHASAGGSFETGREIMKVIYEAPAPTPVPYDFINRAGDTKKMSASKGTGIAASEAVMVLPPEVLRYFVLSFPPEKRLYFDQIDGTVRLVDEYAALSAKTDLTDDEKHTLFICTRGSNSRTVSRVPFSHLVASYQAALKNVEATLAIIKRTEHADVVEADKDIIVAELSFIQEWLDKWAPEDVKFTVQSETRRTDFSQDEQDYFSALANVLESAPADADGEWFHKAIYAFKGTSPVDPKNLFVSLYKLIINKSSGPRAGWFLSLLPRDWLIKRLRFEA